MIKYVFIIFSINLLLGQEFEGIIRYDMRFEVKDDADIKLKKKFGANKESDTAMVVYTNGIVF